jgi:hypothetical protein
LGIFDKVPLLRDVMKEVGNGRKKQTATFQYVVSKTFNSDNTQLE